MDIRMGLTERQQWDRMTDAEKATEEAQIQEGLRIRDTRTLARRLGDVARIDEQEQPDYARRELLLLEALLLARRLGIPAGFRLDPAEPDWPVFQIELPAGQVSWHMPGHPVEWDGHDGPTKAARIAAFAEKEGQR